MPKYRIVSSSQIEKRTKHGRRGKIDSELRILFLVRESSFSLEIRAIRPSAVFGTRRKTALRGEGFAWVPDLGSFLKLREVGVSPYLGFLRLSIMFMIRLVEALNGRLICPKPWDRIDIIFGTPNGAAVN